MSACSLGFGRMLCSWMSPVMQVLRLLLLTLIGSAGSYSLQVVGSWAWWCFVSGCYVRLGGHQVRKARGNVSDVNDDAGVFLYRDSSIAPLLDMRRRFRAVFGCS